MTYFYYISSGKKDVEFLFRLQKTSSQIVLLEGKKLIEYILISNSTILFSLMFKYILLELIRITIKATSMDKIQLAPKHQST